MNTCDSLCTRLLIPFEFVNSHRELFLCVFLFRNFSLFEYFFGPVVLFVYLFYDFFLLLLYSVFFHNQCHSMRISNSEYSFIPYLREPRKCETERTEDLAVGSGVN